MYGRRLKHLHRSTKVQREEKNDRRRCVRVIIRYVVKGFLAKVKISAFRGYVPANNLLRPPYILFTVSLILCFFFVNAIPRILWPLSMLPRV